LIDTPFESLHPVKNKEQKMECCRGFQTTNQITESCTLGRNYAIWLKVTGGAKTTALERAAANTVDKCHYGVVTTKPDDCHCMWKMMANRDDQPMAVKDIAKALCIKEDEVETTLELALRKVKNSKFIIELVKARLDGIDIYEGLTPYHEDVDMWCEHSLSGLSGTNYEKQEPVDGEPEKKRRGPMANKKVSISIAD
jgi:hypothetical protein